MDLQRSKTDNDTSSLTSWRSDEAKGHTLFLHKQALQNFVRWPQKYSKCFSFRQNFFYLPPETHESRFSHCCDRRDLIPFLCPHKCSFKKLSRQICLNIWLMMFISPTGHRGLISSLATWWPISSYSGWEEGDGWGYNHPLPRHILLSYSGALQKKNLKPIRRLPDLSIC